MDRAGLGQLFRSESRDHLDALSRTVLELERGQNREAVDEAFRVVHTLKGMAAAMGYQSVATLAHGVEHLLDRLRSGVVVIDAEVVDLLLQAVDQLEQVTEQAWSADEERGFAASDEAAGGQRRGGQASAGTGEAASAGRYVRVEQGRIDRLVDRAGELVVSREQLLGRAEASVDPGVAQAAGELGRAITEIRDEVLRLRLAPVGEIFDRLHRLTRDTSRGLAKTVRLETEGGTVEMDRALIGDLADLLTHLLRNALDHGIELPEVRSAAGKDPIGTVWVTTASDYDAVVVRVEDDGRGIDLEAIGRRAVAAGLRSPDAGPAIGTEDLFDLLTRPGFSTAREVTEVSGRGVGLDRVASRLRELGGNLEIENWFGKGAAFTLRLPKTLSLTRILLIGCGTQLLAVPSAAVERVTDHGSASPISRREAANGEEAGALILDLGRLLGTRRPDKRTEGFIVVVSGSGRRLGLRVDSLFGFRDVVVKPYAVPRQALDVFAGAAILSDGQPCLVLQPARLLSLIPAGSATDAPPLAGTAKA